jgi:hypothetical protein
MANAKQKFVFELGLGVSLKDKKVLQKIVEGSLGCKQHSTFWTKVGPQKC